MANKKKSGINVSSAGKVVDSEKNKKDLKDLKDNAAASKKRAEENRKKAASKKDDKGDGSDAAALIGKLAKGKDGKSSKLKTIIIAVVVLLIVGVGGTSLSSVLGLGDLFGGGEKDDVMGWTTIDFQEAVLGEAREKQELIVLEQDVTVNTEISTALANIALLKKTKRIKSQGVGVYTVDMSQIAADDVVVDEAARTVTVKIPHTVLQYVNVDNSKTEFEQTEQLIPIGDFKLTAEQNNVVDQAIDEEMRAILSTDEQMASADEVALLKVAEVYQPLVSAVSDQFVVIAEFK